MLKTWQVSNFKSIREMAEPVEFAPLTIFCGTNSSGKSSLLQSILLFKQTLEKKGNMGPRMTLNGDLVKLGSFDDIVTKGLSEDNDKKIKCTFQIDKSKISFAETFGNNTITFNHDYLDNSNSSEGTEIIEELYHDGILATLKSDTLKLVQDRIKFPETDNPQVGFCIYFGSPKDKDNELRYPRITSIDIIESIHKLYKDKKLLNCEYLEGFSDYPASEVYFLKETKACFYPDDRVRNIPADGNDDNNKIVEFYEENKDKLTDNDNAIDCFFPKLDFDGIDKNKIWKDWDSLIEAIFAKSHYEYAKDTITDFFSKKLYYVGPLRADPKENTDTASQNISVGPRGEYTADYFTPHSNLDKDSVYKWLKYVGVADEAGVDNRGELFVNQGNVKNLALKNVGVGVSQILPIIVQCIAAEPGSTIIIEQPELHLHPKMQSRLAEFFLEMSLSGRQIIIETHSEYIIDKLRLHIAQAPSDAPINDKVAIYFSEKKDDNSEFRRIHINEYSVMSEWPEGFFDESMKTAREIMLAAEEKKLKNSGASEEDDSDY